MNALTVVIACLTLLLPSQHVKRVIDGDTFVLYTVGVPPEAGVRVLDVDTPEKGALGFSEAGNFAARWLSVGPFTFHSCRRDSFGRYLAVVSRGSETLAAALIAAGHGSPAARTVHRSLAAERVRQ